MTYNFPLKYIVKLSDDMYFIFSTDTNYHLTVVALFTYALFFILLLLSPIFFKEVFNISFYFYNVR